MKNRNCPNKDACWDYDASNCEGCATGQKIEKFARKIKRLQAKNAEIRHRAEIAERALRNLAQLCAEGARHYLQSNEAVKERERELYDEWVKQAEKELADEGSAV